VVPAIWPLEGATVLRGAERLGAALDRQLTKAAEGAGDELLVKA
jgi:hypothetical protein